APERRRPDPSDEAARRAMLARVTAGSTNAVVVTEGLIIYLEDAQVESLARDLGAVPPIRTWITDIASPALVKMMTERGGAMIAAAGAPHKFAPPQGAEVFLPLRWEAARGRPPPKTAGGLEGVPPVPPEN